MTNETIVNRSKSVQLLDALESRNFVPAIDGETFDLYAGISDRWCAPAMVRVKFAVDDATEVEIHVLTENEVSLWSTTITNAPARVLLGMIDVAIRDAEAG